MTSVKKITLTPTKTVATYGNTYTSGTKINVKVTSKDNSIPYGTVKVYSNGKVYATQLLSNGKTTFKITGLREGTQKISVKYWGSEYYKSMEFSETKTITASDLNTKLQTQKYTLDLNYNYNPRIKIYALDLVDRVNKLGYGKGTIKYTLNRVSKTVSYNPSATVKSTPVTFNYNGENGIYTITAKYTSTNGKTLTTYYKAEIYEEEIYS